LKFIQEGEKQIMAVNLKPPPSVCPRCNQPLVSDGHRFANPWPEDGTLYPVEKYSCLTPGCEDLGLEHWWELPD